MNSNSNYQPEPEDFRYLEDTLYVIGGKWTLLIMHSLSLGNRRFTYIKQSIPKITPRVLSKELKRLEMNNLVRRSVHDKTRVSIDYEVTQYCKSFEPIIKAAIAWGKLHRGVITGKTNDAR